MVVREYFFSIQPLCFEVGVHFHEVPSILSVFHLPRLPSPLADLQLLMDDGRYPQPNPLPQWYSSRSGSTLGYDLLCKLFEWDPAKRITARECLSHAWFQEEGGVATQYVLAFSFPLPVYSERSTE